MAMELVTFTIQAATLMRDDTMVDVAAGQSLKIETTPSGEEVLNTECPEGKVWSARIIVEITETDA